VGVGTLEDGRTWPGTGKRAAQRARSPSNKLRINSANAPSVASGAGSKPGAGPSRRGIGKSYRLAFFEVFSFRSVDWVKENYLYGLIGIERGVFFLIFVFQ